MTDRLKASWDAARQHVRGAIEPLVEANLDNGAARLRALALRDRLGGQAPLLSDRAPDLRASLLSP